MAHSHLLTTREPHSSRLTETRFGLFIVVGFLLLLIPRIVAHVYWRDELQVWMLVSDHPSLPKLFSQLRYEGHPYLWHVLVWAASFLWHDPAVMKLLHAAIAGGIAYLVAACMPLPRLHRILLVTSYFLAFEYAVISRNYALGVLALFAYASLRVTKPAALVPAALALTLAAQANVYTAYLATAIAIAEGLHWLWRRTKFRRSHALATFIVVAGFGLSLSQLLGPSDRAYSPTTIDFNHQRAGKMMASVWRSFVPIPDPIRTWWSTNILDFTLDRGLLRLTQPLLGIVLLAIATWIIPWRNRARLTWLIGAAIYFAFGYFKFSGSLRHHGMLFVLFVLACWLGGEQTGQRTTTRNAALLIILILQAIAGVIASTADALLPMSASRAVARYILSNNPEALVIGERDFTTSPLSALLDRPIYYTRAQRWGTYIIWNRARLGPASAEELLRAAKRLHKAAPDREILLVYAGESAPDFSGFAPIERFQDASEKGERYTLLRYVP